MKSIKSSFWQSKKIATITKVTGGIQYTRETTGKYCDTIANDGEFTRTSCEKDWPL